MKPYYTIFLQKQTISTSLLAAWLVEFDRHVSGRYPVGASP